MVKYFSPLQEKITTVEVISHRNDDHGRQWLVLAEVDGNHHRTTVALAQVHPVEKGMIFRFNRSARNEDALLEQVETPSNDLQVRIPAYVLEAKF